ncbi:MAG: hypothetical protein GXX96_35200 [Planctomycetaceae bacterium]|nr:hypothetical protein [Planctomycetaceae bacterium]
MFEAAGIGNEQLATLAEGDPCQPSSGKILQQMLYRIRQDVRPGDLERWSLGDLDLQRLTDDPEAYRLQVFRLRGRVVSVESCPLSSQGKDDVEFASIWRCRMHLDSDERTVDVLAAHVPKAWSVGKTIDEPAGAMAFFLTTLPPDGDGAAPCFLADRMAWYPPTFLGRLGMDVGLLDDVVVEPPPQRSPDGSSPDVNWATRQLTESDRECFYQMLKAVGAAEDGQLNRWAQEELKALGESSFSVVPLFNAPQTQQGKLVELTGVARRILPVRVSEKEVVDRFGIEEYYQIYLFTDDSQDNPIVFCLHELPKGLPLGDGPGFGEQLTVPGFFFKTWSYRVPAVVADGKPQRQLAPLLIGKSARWHPVKAPSGLSPLERLIGTVLLLLILGVVWWIFRQFARGDREFARQVRRRPSAAISETDWESLDSSAKEDDTA